MPQYSLPRRIWRAIYPALLFFAPSGIVAFFAGIIISAKMMAGQDLSVIAVDTDAIAQEMQNSITANTMLFALIGYLLSVVIFLPMWRKTRKRYRRFGGGGFNIGTAALTLGLSVGLYFLISGVFALTDITRFFPSYQMVEDALTADNLPMRMIAVGLFAPVVEELCFRGVTLNRLSNKKIWLAVLIQAALFGIIHFNLLQGIYAVILGVVFGYIYVRFKSLWYPVIAHISFNMIGQLMSALASRADAEIADAGGAAVGGAIVLVFGLLLTAVFAYCLLRRPAAPEPEGWDEPEVTREYVLD
ncbi:MAG: CPBP family intramembrane metalloprotease [Oscillospiraceae bacterium]|jgi:membrane protease YdiL (CAAX protease family)|nr:CPBP family intramembrane metalloprotease [Oscillospiraceae bacterium]